MRSRITGLAGIAQRVAGGDVLEAGKRDDVAGIGFLDVLAVIGVHQQHAADALFLVLHRVEQGRAGLDLAGIDAAEGQRADERVVHDLEGQHGERLVVRRRDASLPLRSSTSMPLIGGTSSGDGR